MNKDQFSQLMKKEKDILVSDLKGLLSFFIFMTRLPLGYKPKFNPEELGRNIKFFPFVGMILGILLFTFLKILLYAFGISDFRLWSLIRFENNLMPIIAITLIIIDTIITGPYHFSGLASTFDGIFAFRSKQKMIERMKEDRVATNGVIVIVLYFMLKFVLFLELGQLYDKNILAAVILITPVIARLNGVVNCKVALAAKKIGIIESFVRNTTTFGFIFATIFTLIYTAIICHVLDVSYCILGIIPVIMGLGYIFAKVMNRKIGGITEDTIGAVVKLSEVVIMYFCFIIVI